MDINAALRPTWVEDSGKHFWGWIMAAVYERAGRPMLKGELVSNEPDLFYTKNSSIFFISTIRPIGNIQGDEVFVSFYLSSGNFCLPGN